MKRLLVWLNWLNQSMNGAPQTDAPLAFSLLHTFHRVPKNQKTDEKTLKLDRNITLNIRLLNVTRTTIRRAIDTGASVRGVTVAGAEMSLVSKCRGSIYLENTIRVTWLNITGNI
jgi:hypothetical protein